MTVTGSIWLLPSLRNCVAIKEIVITEIVSLLIRTETNDPDSLQATSTRQNIRQSLVHITDTACTFTERLTGHVLTLQNSDTLMKKGENKHQFVLDNAERTRFLAMEQC